MKPLPRPENDATLLIRTDFSAESAWETLRQQLQKPSDEGFLAVFEYVIDRDYEDLTIPQLLALDPKSCNQLNIFVADRTTLADAEFPILVLDVHDQPGRSFRVIPSEAWSVENNLSLCNMDFEEFAENTDSNGVFRGFD